MMTNRQLGWQKLFLVLTVLSCCRSIEVSIPEKEYEVARGGEINLICSFIPAQAEVSTVVITWEAFPDNENDPLKAIATYFSGNQVDIAPAYGGRAFMDVNLIKHESTLRLTKVTMQDNRRYQCSVQIPGDSEGTQAAITSLLVLVAPSPPICSIKGRAEYWHNISLTCMSEEGSPTPVYQWKSYSVENNPRPFPPKTTEMDGVLSLFNISREMSGFYICTSTNPIASASCNFTLAVMPGGANEASLAAVVGGVVAGVLVLGILIFCCCRRNGKNDKYVEGAAGDVQYYEKDGPEVGDQYVDEKSNSEMKQSKQYEDKNTVPQSYFSAGPDGHKFDDDQNSHYSGQERNDGKGSDIDSQRYRDDQHDRGRLDDQRGRYGGSRDRLEDQRDRYGGSRDRLEDQRDRYGGSRDRLDDQRDRYGGSRDRLDDQRDRYRGSRDRLDDQRDRYGSRDRLDDQRDRYGSRDRLDDQQDRYRGSRDRLDDQRDRYGSRDRLDDQRDRYGSRDRLDDQRDHYRGSRDRLDDHYDRQGSDHYDRRGSRDHSVYSEDQYRK